MVLLFSEFGSSNFSNTNILAGTSSLFMNKCHYIPFLPKDSFKYYKVLLCILSIACQCKESTPAISVVWCCFTQILARFLGDEARGFLSATVNDTGRWQCAWSSVSVRLHLLNGTQLGFVQYIYVFCVCVLVSLSSQHGSLQQHYNSCQSTEAQ